MKQYAIPFSPPGAEKNHGSVSFPLIKNMKLSNMAAILIRSIPDEMEIIDG